MKKILYLLCLAGFCFSAVAQPQGGEQRPATTGHIYGKLVDSAGKGIGDASVLLLESKLDSTTKKIKEVLLKGGTTQANGDFTFEEIATRGKLKLKISATGFGPFGKMDATLFKRKNTNTDSEAGLQGAGQ